MQIWPWGLGSLNRRPGGFSSEQGLPESGLSQHPGLHAGVGRETVPLQRAVGSGASQSWGWVSPGLRWTVFSCTAAIRVGQVLPCCAPVQAPGRAWLCPWAGTATPASDRDAAASLPGDYFSVGGSFTTFPVIYMVLVSFLCSSNTLTISLASHCLSSFLFHHKCFCQALSMYIQQTLEHLLF